MRNAIITIVILFGVVGGYVLYTSFGGTPTEPLVKPSGLAGSPDTVAFSGNDFVKMLVSLKSVKLDDAVLRDQRFTSLRDFSVKLQSQEIGRLNPFAVIGAQ